jgi:ATP-dependent RNA helicase RhlE
MSAQIRGLKQGPDIIVACPGRLLDLYSQGFVDFSTIEALVLDEADHMFDMGFLPSIRKILELLPEKRQNLMFSATMPSEIRRLADAILSDPHVVELAHTKPAETIAHALYPVRPQRKRDLLEYLLGSDDCQSAIVFTRTKHRAQRLAEQLAKAGHEAVALQGNMSQSQRDKAMKGFRKGHFDVLVATDIVARGIDVSDVSYVINYDAPNTPEAYTHRIGRTGRAERLGRACTLVSTEDGAWIRATEHYLGAAIERCQVPGFEGVLIRGLAEQESEPVRGRGGRGKRRSYGRRGRARRA